MKLLLGVLGVSLVAACGGDDACKTPTTWCEAGVVMRCEGGAPVMEEDCAALGESIGVEKQCGTLKAAEDKACVDLRQMSCATAGLVECAPGHKAQRTCTETDFGMIWNSDSLEPTCSAGEQCHPTTMGEFVCVMPPIETCATRSECDGMTLKTCAGNATDGYVVTAKKTCPTMCEVRLDGTAVCN